MFYLEGRKSCYVIVLCGIFSVLDFVDLLAEDFGSILYFLHTVRISTMLQLNSPWKAGIWTKVVDLACTPADNKRPPQALAGPLKPLKCSQKAEFFCASRH